MAALFFAIGAVIVTIIASLVVARIPVRPRTVVEVEPSAAESVDEA